MTALRNDRPIVSTKRKATDMLIGTKLYMPLSRAVLLPRTHLVDRLSAGSDCPLIVISGVPGSGKTSLATQWVKKNRLPTAWYSLDPADNDEDLFFRYLLTALSNVDEYFASEAIPLMQAQKRLSGRETVPFVIEGLAGLSRDTYLVLDDYHLIRSSEIHDALSYFLERMPAKVHVVLISRHAIPLPLSRFRVHGQIMEISASSMRFTEEETEQFFTRIMPVKLSAGEISELARCTEGWVGGLQLFGLSLVGRDTLDGLGDVLNRVCRETTDYLVDEVVNAQPEMIRVFLRATALVDRFNVDLCREISQLPEAGEILDHLYQHNLFIIPLDTERTWHRYHHLLSGAIRKSVKKASPEMFVGIHKKAALWFARNGYLEDAFRHAFASEDLEFAADMLEDHLMVLYDRYEISSFRRWLSRLPDHILLERTLLRLHECRFNIESTQLLEASALLRDIESHRSEAFARYDAPKRQLCDDYLLLFNCILPFWMEPLKVNIGELQDALGRISPQKTFLPGMMKVVIGSSYLFRGEIVQAGETAREATTTVLSSESLSVKILWFRLMASVERWQGHLRGAETMLRKGFTFLEQKGLTDAPLGCMLQFEMAWVCYYRNDLKKAFDCMTAALIHLDPTGFVHEIVTGYYLLGLVLVGQGEIEGASQCVLRIESVSRSYGESYVIALADAFCARLSVARGDLAWADHWAIQRAFRLDEPFSFRFAHECLALAELHYSKRRYKEVVHTLESLRQQCKSRNLGELLLDADLLCCAALYRSGEHDEAQSILERSLAASRTDEYVRLFVNRAVDLTPILLNLAARFPSTAPGLSYLDTVIKACDIGEHNIQLPARDRCRGGAGLTVRELEMLELLSQGHKYREIGDKCFISLDTVRTHIKHIFQKLGVKTRSQAILRATMLSILDNR